MVVFDSGIISDKRTHEETVRDPTLEKGIQEAMVDAYG
jgi:hypothetical protein